MLNLSFQQYKLAAPSWTKLILIRVTNKVLKYRGGGGGAKAGEGRRGQENNNNNLIFCHCLAPGARGGGGARAGEGRRGQEKEEEED